MFGGTAKTYCSWTFDGEPFKDGAVYYIYAIHPKTQAKKKVRFYSDKAHAALMPQKSQHPLYLLFGFDSTEDYILCIDDSLVSDEEEQEYFPHKWKNAAFFGGVWYASKDASIPPLKNQSKVRKVYWKDFKRAGQENSRKIGLVSEDESSWFKEDLAV